MFRLLRLVPGPCAAGATAMVLGQRSRDQPTHAVGTGDGASHNLKHHFLTMDEKLVKVIEAGEMRLVKAASIRDGTLSHLSPLQTLEAESPQFFCTPREAATLIKRGDRSVAVLSHAWLNGEVNHPDVTHGKLRAVQNLLEYYPQVEAVFFDYMSVPQVLKDKRSDEDQARFNRAVPVMPALYASPMGTMVVRLKASPPGRHYNCRGWCILETCSAMEVIQRAAFFPQLKELLDPLPPKLVDIGGVNIRDKRYDGKAPPIEVAIPPPPAGGERARIDATRKCLERATFHPNYPSDRELTLEILNGFITDVDTAMYAAARELGGGEGTYEGERNSAGQREGHGTFQSVGGDEYVGEWRADRMEGRGTERYADGNVFVGTYRAGKPHGCGTLWYAARGEVEIGRYRGEPIPVGEGVLWSSDRQKAWRMRDGERGEEIALTEALKCAGKLGFSGVPGKRP